MGAPGTWTRTPPNHTQRGHRVKTTTAPADLELVLPLEATNLLLSENGRGHWRERARLSRYWRTLTQIEARSLINRGTWPRLQRAHITVTISWPDRIRRDPANYTLTAKPIVDGLVDAGLLPDDDHEHVTGPDMRRARGPLQIHLLIEPLPPTTDSGSE